MLVFDKPCYKCRSHTCELSCKEPEPVAWFHAETYKTYFTTSPDTHLKGKYWFPLFASPTQRKPLTEQQIEDLGPLSFTWRDMVEFARAIEAAHGVGGEK